MYVVYKNLFFQKEYGTQRTFAPFFCVKPDYVIKLTSYHERFFLHSSNEIMPFLHAKTATTTNKEQDGDNYDFLLLSSGFLSLSIYNSWVGPKSPYVVTIRNQTASFQKNVEVPRNSIERLSFTRV